MEDPVVVRGVPLRLHPSPDYLSDHIRRTGDFFEADILDELARRVTGGTIVDAGAMLGNHTVYFAEFIPRSTVVAFEPVRANLNLLYENVAPYINVKVYGWALSDRRRMVRLTVDPANYGHATIEDGGLVDGLATTLDSLELYDVSLLKVDVEGHEPQVLAGARATISLCHPLVLIEDWKREYGALLPGYRLAAEWEQAHQTFLYEWVG